MLKVERVTRVFNNTVTVKFCPLDQIYIKIYQFQGVYLTLSIRLETQFLYLSIKLAYKMVKLNMENNCFNVQQIEFRKVFVRECF